MVEVDDTDNVVCWCCGCCRVEVGAFYFIRGCFSIGGHEERSRVKIQCMSVVCHAEGGDFMTRLATKNIAV